MLSTDAAHSVWRPRCWPSRMRCPRSSRPYSWRPRVQDPAQHARTNHGGDSRGLSTSACRPRPPGEDVPDLCGGVRPRPQQDGRLPKYFDVAHVANITQSMVSEGARHWAAGTCGGRSSPGSSAATSPHWSRATAQHNRARAVPTATVTGIDGPPCSLWTRTPFPIIVNRRVDTAEGARARDLHAGRTRIRSSSAANAAAAAPPPFPSSSAAPRCSAGEHVGRAAAAARHA